jgi:hypothetical protein
MKVENHSEVRLSRKRHAAQKSSVKHVNKDSKANLLITCLSLCRNFQYNFVTEPFRVNECDHTLKALRKREEGVPALFAVSSGEAQLFARCKAQRPQ